MKLIDSHCHLEMDDFDEDRNDVFKRIEDKLELAIQVASDIPSNQNVLEYCEKYPFIYGAIGLHPHDSESFSDEFYQFLEKNISLPKILAVGEIGLDYFKAHSPVETQKTIFRTLLRFAKKHDKPVIIHSREAFEDILQILNEEKIERVVFHCFSGNWEEAQKILGKGYMLSFSGTVTFPKNLTGQEVLKNVPMDRFFVETDAPFLTPVPFRGKRNEPVYVEHTAKKAAELKQLPIEKIVEATSQNVKRFFGIK